MNMEYIKIMLILVLLILSYEVLYLCKIKMYDNINIEKIEFIYSKVLSLCEKY